MAELHDALAALGPIAWDQVPRNGLADYIVHSLADGELIINSVPPLPEQGTPFHQAHPHHTSPNQAKTSKDIVASAARGPAPHESHTQHQQHWGKPLKLNAKENPLHVALFKMAGRDRRGAWFARRSVHEGIGFERFKAAMLREFPESLLVQGPPGAGAKRGLGAEQRLEQIDVPGVGRLEVYLLSAQMPPPVSPREFLPLLVSSDHALSDKSAAQLSSGKRHVPRNFMVVSRPTDHPRAPPRAAFVRGQYESVELIREIPLHKADSGSGEDKHAELNPVEWIMVTRSDPGGGIPRFMVDRGTPSAMLADLSKFLDWACGDHEIPGLDDDREKQRRLSSPHTEQVNNVDFDGASMVPVDEQAAATTNPTKPLEVNVSRPSEDNDDVADPTPTQTQYSGFMSTIANTLEAGVTAPRAVSNYIHGRITGSEQPSEDDSDSSSAASFMSAEELRRITTAEEHLSIPTSDSVSVQSDISTAEVGTDGKKLNRHEKEIRKLTAKREKLELEQSKRREAEEIKFRQSLEKESVAHEKAREQRDRELRKVDERHQREMQKLAAKQEREAAKAEAKRRKRDDASKLSIITHERDNLRSQLDMLRRENELLLAQVEGLQRENTALASRLGKLGGSDALKGLPDEVDTRRKSSMRSSESQLSVRSAGSSVKST